MASLYHYAIETVARDGNRVVTDQRQVWHAPSKKINKPDFLENINIQKIKGK